MHVLFAAHRFLLSTAAFYTPFFKEVWEKKPEIEQAFHMEEPAGLDDSGEGTLEHPARTRHGPQPPPRHESYLLKLNDGSGSENYELNGPDERLSSSDHSDKYSHIYMYGGENGDVIGGKGRLHQGFQVYPPPTTPPEPAPPDHPLGRLGQLGKRPPNTSASQTSLDEITCKYLCHANTTYQLSILYLASFNVCVLI